MARDFPSMTALLGLLAVAGFQNRDRIAELLRGGTGAADAGRPPHPGQAPSDAGASTGGGGGLLSGGLSELVERFRQTGMGDTASSWVGPGPNREVAPQDLEQAIGPDMIRQLTAKTGLSRDDLLQRLSRDLPAAVDSLTPDGRLPGPGTAGDGHRSA